MWPDLVIAQESECTKDRAISLARQLQQLFPPADKKSFHCEEVLCLVGHANITVTEIENLLYGKEKINGLLIPIKTSPKSFALKIEKHLSLAEKKFALAHELGHTFFIDWQHSTASSWRLSTSLKILEEYFCDVFAATLLYPLESAEECRKWGWSDPAILRASAESYEIPNFVPLWVQLDFSPDFWSGRQSCS